MPRQALQSVEKNFTRGLITEATGLNFPENACTETYDCEFNKFGEVSRRLGFDYETNYAISTITNTGAISHNFTWNNPGGTNDEVIVQQIGTNLHFWRSSSATDSTPLSNQKLASTVDISAFIASGAVSLVNNECQFASGDGYLFVFHPNCDPFYCTYNSGVITATEITIQIRDFLGIIESGVADNYRPLTLTSNHLYNLANQGWGKNWTATSSSSVTIGTGSKTFTINSSTLPITVGDRVLINAASEAQGIAGNNMTGTVTSYSGTTLIVSVTSVVGSGTLSTWTIKPKPSFILEWFTDIANYPSNSDVWQYFKDPNDVFDPAGVIDTRSQNAGLAVRGYFVLDAFNFDRTAVSGISSLTVISTSARPKTGCWFAGRVWYAGADAQDYSENIYFSQIIENTGQFGKCYQVNDPTAEDFSDLLPSDGGLIKIQGCGIIHKLFPTQNGLLVHSDSGIWFITGSQGIGFTANDYTVTKIADIGAISGSSFINVKGYPIWWGEEGIYFLTPTQQGLTPQSLTDATIATFYQAIPLTNRRLARGDYDPFNNIVRWVYRSDEPSTVIDRYKFDRVLNFNMQTQAFYPWTITQSSPDVGGIVFVAGPAGDATPDPMFKYLTFSLNVGSSYNFTWSDLHDTNYVDWETTDTGFSYNSYFITGYKIRGEGLRKFQQNYFRIFFDNTASSACEVQTRWDFATSGDTGRWSSLQRIVIDKDPSDYSNAMYRLKTRGHGKVMQLKVNSVDTEPFNIIGWVAYETANQSV